MSVPPLLLYLRVGTAQKPGTGLWLPLFLVWLLLLPIVVLAAAITIVADVVLFLAGRQYHRYTLLLVGALGLLGETRGMTVRIRTKENVVDMDLV